MRNKNKAGKFAIWVLVVILAISAAMVLSSCGEDDKDYSNVYFKQINRNAKSVKAELPFSKGVNFSAWFEKSSPESINFDFYTEQDFSDVSKMGVDVVRVPIRFHDMTTKTETHTLDEKFLKMLDTVVGWAEKYDLHLILDNHSWSPTIGTADNVGEILIPIWLQIAERYKSKHDFLIYELQNEPHQIDQGLWSKIQGEVIAAIKAVDPDCYIIATGTDFASIGGMKALPHYDYSNIIYTFHFYDPYIFTHQGQTWAPPSLTNLTDLPFPADAHEMPQLPSELHDTWVKSSYDNYQKAATVSALERTLDDAVKFANAYKVPIFCGEFGVYVRNSMHEDRLRWYEIVSELLRIRNITYTSWDYYGGFGLFSGGAGLAEYDMNVDIAKALGFNPPEQKVKTPIRSAFEIYQNGPKPSMVSLFAQNCNIDSYYEGGQGYALKWSNVKRYGNLNISFKQEIDFAALKTDDYRISLKVRSADAVKFIVRFLNHESGGKLPWRMDREIQLQGGNDWQTVSFGFGEMQEGGAWNNVTSEFINPRGEFRWDNVESLQLVAEYGDMENDILFSDILVTKPL